MARKSKISQYLAKISKKMPIYQAPLKIAFQIALHNFLLLHTYATIFNTIFNTNNDLQGLELEDHPPHQQHTFSTVSDQVGIRSEKVGKVRIWSEFGYYIQGNPPNDFFNLFDTFRPARNPVGKSLN